MYSKVLMIYLFFIAIAILDFTGALTTYGENDKNMRKRAIEARSAVHGSNSKETPEFSFPPPEFIYKKDCWKYQSDCKAVLKEHKCPLYCSVICSYCSGDGTEYDPKV